MKQVHPFNCWFSAALSLGLVALMLPLTLDAQGEKGSTGASQNPRTDALQIGSTKQLFLDNRVIDRIDNIRLQLHRPVRYSGNPIIEADKAWETGEIGRAHV